MYKYIFYVFYTYHKQGRSFSPRVIAACAVSTTVFFHLFLVANIITYFTGINILGAPLSEDYITNKLYWLPVAIVYTYSFVFHYNHKRAMAIVQSYPSGYVATSLTKIIMVLIIMMLPLFIGILIMQHGH